MKKYIILTALTITLGGALAGAKPERILDRKKQKRQLFKMQVFKKQTFPEFGFPRNRRMGCYLMT